MQLSTFTSKIQIMPRKIIVSNRFIISYARYNNQIVGQDVSLNALLDLWTRLANYYRTNDKVVSFSNPPS